MKKLVSLLLCFVFVLMLLPYSITEVNAATVNHTLEEAIAWCESKIGSGINVDNNKYGNQCVEFIKAYYDYLVGYHYRGNACDYATMTVPSGMTRIAGASPQPGDVLIWTGGSGGYGHVAICGYNNQSYHQNWNGQYVEKLNKTYSNGFTITSTGEYASYWGVIRPIFPGSSPEPEPPITYENISEGAYYLKSNYNGEYLSVAGGKDANKTNVNTWPFAISTEFIMHFTKASQGYKLRPECCSSRLINSYGTTVSSGNNVNIWDDTNESSEWWGFQKVSNGYVIRNMMNPSCVLTVESNGNIIVSTYTGASSQIWSLQNTIQYYANGGSGAPASQIKNYNQSINLSSTKPTRSGYTFLGWSTSESATSATYSAGTSFTKNANTRLYAVWGKNYTVSYNANGGSGAPASQTKVNSVNLTLSNTKPTRTGYTFLGWSTSSSATSASYNAGSTFNSNANTTLYAVWSKNTYRNSITHWLYVGSGGDNSIGDQKKMHVTYFDGTFDSTITIPTYAIQHYTGYYNNGIAGSGWGYDKWVTKNIGETFTQTANSINIEYYYLPKTVTVEFDKNDGSGETSRQTFRYAEQGKRFGFSSDGTPKWYDNCGQFGSWDRWNHTLLGWSKSPNATTPDYSVYEWISDEWVNANAPDSNPNSTITLYAVWKEDIEGIYPYPPETDYTIKGDINRNGDIDSMDYVLLKRAYFGIYSLANEAVGDINGNGQIDSMDYVLLKRAYFGTYEIK